MFKNHRGQSLISALISLSVASLTLLLVLSISDIFRQQQTKVGFTFQVDQLRRNLQLNLNNNVAWTRTVAASENSPPFNQGDPDFGAPPANNAGLNCLIAPGSNCTD